MLTHALYRVALLSVLLAGLTGCGDGDLNIELLEADITTLQQAMSAGELSAVELSAAYLARIERLDPALHAVLEINPDAMEIAGALDRERAQGTVRSALHGIPVLLKDNIDTADRMHTTAGSLALLDAPTPARDAFLVEQLREAGAVILGKTNLSEWANFRSTRSSSGWSARGGQTLNPYDVRRTPCGSSSGSAVAVSANLTVVAVGTETDGSIVCPAAHSGIVGLKPTVGLVSRSGIIPISHSQDTAGPMTRTVRDAALLLNVLAGHDPDDAASSPAAANDYTQLLSPDALRGKRIGVMRHTFGRDAGLDAHMEQQLDLLRRAGATLVDVDIQVPEELPAAEMRVLLVEFKAGVDAYLQGRGGEVGSLEELIMFNRRNADTEMPDFGQELFELAQRAGTVADPSYLRALELGQQQARTLIDQTLASLRLDALVAPTNSQGWLLQPGGDDTTNYVSSSTLAAVAGYPAITVPSDFLDGSAIGISFINRPYEEAALLAIAYAFEQHSLARRPPESSR